MPQITRINDVTYRSFRGFSLPGAVPAFGRFNLIYGWNASGKTTLSSLFRKIEKKEPLADGTAKFVIDERPCDLCAINADTLLSVRVFNRDFIEANVLTSQLAPIFYLGADSVEKQKQVERLREEVAETKTKQGKAEASLSNARSALDTFCSQQAKLIKEVLSSRGGQNPYNNYHKGDFKDVCKKIVAANTKASLLLTADAKASLMRQKEAVPKPAIPILSLALLNTQSFVAEVTELLNETVVSRIIKELSDDPAMADWVYKGLALHKRKAPNATCGFCGQAIPPERLEQLEAHFNDTYNQFIARIDEAITRVRKERGFLSTLAVPESSRLYEHLLPAFEKGRQEIIEHTEKLAAYFDEMEKALIEKRKHAFERVAFKPSTEPPDDQSGSIAITRLNELIQAHNAQTADFETAMGGARKRLEDGFVAQALDEFVSKENLIKQYLSEMEVLKASAQKGKEAIASLETEIVQHRRPAEELSVEIASYLGSDYLKLAVNETGYSLMRGGSPATNLSEGEKTAFAFLYFLKSLQDKSFDLTKGVVVIDDPVSSLDSNSLFSAFGFMKERTKEVGQLFILTHNFGFFRQVKNWFNNLPHQRKSDISQRPARFYMLEAQYDGQARSSKIKVLDPLLHEFESEYH